MWVSNKRDLLYDMQSHIKVLLTSLEKKLVTNPWINLFSVPELFNIAAFMWLSKNQYQHNYSDQSQQRDQPIRVPSNYS